MVNWGAIWNRLFYLIDQTGEASYFSGGRFLSKVREIEPFYPGYNEVIEERNRLKKSTSRKDYFRDIFMSFDEGKRARLAMIILDEVASSNVELASEIRQLLGGGEIVAPAPVAIPEAAWSSTRLNEQINLIDSAIAAGDYGRAITLSYTCMEGFLGAFVRARSPRNGPYPNEIVVLAKEAKDYLKQNIAEYPDELLNLVTQTAHAVDRARNRFSESHFGNEAASWMAKYVRDLVNSEIRLLVHFM